jgi:quercetin dioxygenase-like cupin family protein
MKTPPPLVPVVTLPGTGRVMSAFGDELTVLLSGEQTGGAFSMVQIVTPPGGGPPPHYHTMEDEWFLVQEGRAEFLMDGVWKEVPPGSAAFMPRGAEHSFRNAGDTPLRLLVHTAPAGFEVFFARMAETFHSPDGPDMARIIGIAAEHGIFFVEPGGA